MTSLERQCQQQSEQRLRTIKLMLLVVLSFGIVFVALWWWVTQPLPFKRRDITAAMVDPARLEHHVRKLSVELHPRDESNPENLDRVAAYIRVEFANLGARLFDQSFTVNGKTYRNVIGEFGPETDERIVVGAHYDTAGPLPGADDNASGVAGLIELAALLAKQQLPLRVELVAFTLEEPPYFGTAFMGSAVHANDLRQQNAKVRAMISLEMIGYFSEAPGSQHFPAALLSLFYPTTGNFIAVVGTLSEGLLVRQVKAAMQGANELPVHSINAPTIVPGVGFSDQLNYWNAGYHAVMITDTAFFRNPNYHTPEDTAEKLDYKRMAMVVEGVYAAVLELGRNP